MNSEHTDRPRPPTPPPEPVTKPENNIARANDTPPPGFWDQARGKVQDATHKVGDGARYAEAAVVAKAGDLIDGARNSAAVQKAESVGRTTVFAGTALWATTFPATAGLSETHTPVQTDRPTVSAPAEQKLSIDERVEHAFINSRESFERSSDGVDDQLKNDLSGDSVRPARRPDESD